ncbi:Por secretion system C-terminal sorting domain-containing protein [Flexibacter flexilis DSM 6793]|uniref:Por secretion system C-terminal sorting domain-containing protein n=1 Tax=Flexibacter flexilis DSM 6793 TaxID=927664 RepID=A0A1I1IMG5_9BACT|nr:T9SS type A sorting domain-containing protein [Flexibacter flexilis]SFC37454.1 Por secretion system C-terminal sorting domain-containing protein [Flexibacter flexilis DSM 6793]
MNYHFTRLFGLLFFAFNSWAQTAPNAKTTHAPLIPNASNINPLTRTTALKAPNNNSSTTDTYAIKQQLDSVVAPLSKKYCYTYNASGKTLSEIQYSWAAGINSWIYYLKNEYTYDTNGRQTQSSTYINSMFNTWIGSEKNEYTYNAIGNNTLIIYYVWNTTNHNWQYSTKHEYIYNTNNQLIQDTYYNWSNNVWVAYSKINYTYTNNNQTQAATYKWNANNNNWTNYSKEDYVYNNVNQLTQKITAHWGGNVWANDYKYEYAYINNNLTQIITNSWGTTSNTWSNYIKEEYTYNTNNQVLLYTTYYFSNNSWVGMSKFEYIYDANSSLTTNIHSTWNSSNSSWRNYLKSEFTYNSNNDETSESYYAWDNTANTWLSYGKQDYTHNTAYAKTALVLPYSLSNARFFSSMVLSRQNSSWVNSTWQVDSTFTYYYSPQGATSVRENEQTAASLYPVPAKDILNIALLDNENEATIEIFDMQGRKVLAQNLLQNVSQITVNQLQTGLYLYNIRTTNERVQNGKFVKQ